MIIEPQFDSASPFYKGLAVVKVGGKYGYIDKSGRCNIGNKYICKDGPVFSHQYSLFYRQISFDIRGSLVLCFHNEN